MEEDIKIVHFTGWHGTDRKNAEEILKINFKESQGNLHWLGDGVYFFYAGVGNPQIHALKWARSEAHKKGFDFDASTVLKAEISVKRGAIMDFRQDGALELFSHHKDFVLKKIREAHRGFLPQKAYNDSMVIDHMKHILSLEVIIMNFYVKFLLDRIQKIESKFPNCTFLCISNPKMNIDQGSIQILGMYNV